jgi:adenine-specific DNA-methyltransferase
MQNLLEQLKTTLQADERFIIDGKLAKNKIIECALAIDEDLIDLLLENEAIKQHFLKKLKVF